MGQTREEKLALIDAMLASRSAVAKEFAAIASRMLPEEAPPVYEPPRMLGYVFPLRREPDGSILRVEFRLPIDLSQEDADRLVGILRALAFGPADGGGS